MNNTERELIKVAAEKEIITQEDYTKWKAMQRYASILTLSVESFDLNKAIYFNEKSKAESYFFERDLSAHQNRYVLRGDNFQPINLSRKKDIMRAFQYNQNRGQELLLKLIAN